MIKLNCDMGEGFGAWSMGMDAEIMPYVDMANIACGFHASDPFIMSTTVALAKSYDVTIGAHPGYPDLSGFGRRDMAFSYQEIADLFTYQVGALQAICQTQSTEVSYIKPHGALYHLMMRDEKILQVIMRAVAGLTNDKPLPLVVLANSQFEDIKQLAEKTGITVLFEAFCDRAYTDDGSLASRNIDGAVFEDDALIEQRIHELISEKRVTTLSGNTIPIDADTICVHGDNPHAVQSVKKIRQYIQTVNA